MAAPQIEYRFAPAHLTARCLIPELGGDRAGALVDFYFNGIDALRACNANMAALRAWRETYDVTE